MFNIRRDTLRYCALRGLTRAELAQHQGLAQEIIAADISVLMEWLAIEQDELGRLLVPWDEIDVHFPLASKAA